MMTLLRSPNLRAGINIFFTLLLLSCAITLAPASRLLAFNADYFGISALELLVSVLLVGSISSLLFLALIALLSTGNLATARISSKNSSEHVVSLIYLGFILLLVSSVLYSFIIPVQLTAIDGPGEFEVRREAAYGSIATLVIFIGAIAVRKAVPALYYKTFSHLRTLVTFALLYVAGFTAYSFTETPIFSFTGNTESDTGFNLGSKNIFIISFDQVQGSLVAQLLKDDPAARATFDGFVFYPDAASTYPNTNYSLASMVLGRPVDSSSETYQEALRSQSSLMAAATTSGAKIYTNRQSTEYECLNCTVEKTEFNTRKIYELARHSANLAFGIDIHQEVFESTFSSLGLIGPLGSLPEYEWKVDLHKFRTLAQEMHQAEAGTNLYFMHFLGTHQPFTYERDCSLMSASRIAESQNSRGAVDSAYCFLSLIRGFLEKLEQHDAYDRSTILLTSDHGYEREIQRSQPFASYFPETADAIGDPRNIKPAGAYNPILFLKTENNRGPMQFNHSTASLIDIAPTVCAVLDCRDYQWSGYDLTVGDPPPERTREFWMYLGSSDRRIPGGGDKLHDGLDDYWEKRGFSGPIYPNLAISMGFEEPHARPQLKTGEIIAFGKSGKSDLYTRTGWHQPEENHRWTNGRHASLSIQLETPPTRDFVLSLHLAPYISNTIEHQDVGVTVNDQPVANWRIMEAGEYSAIVPGSVVADGRLNVLLDISSPASPCATGQSSDCRTLGVAARELSISVQD